jgi:hypothetical protein
MIGGSLAMLWELGSQARDRYSPVTPQCSGTKTTRLFSAHDEAASTNCGSHLPNEP